MQSEKNAMSAVDGQSPARVLPKGWKWVRLGDVSEVIAGQSPPGKSYNSAGVGAEFHQGKVAFGDTTLKVSGKWTTESRRFAEPGDVVMSVRAPVGPVNLVDRSVAIGRGLASIRVNHGWLTTDWLFHHMRNIGSELTGTPGSTFASINKSQIEEIPVPLAPLQDQRRVVRAVEERFRMIDSARLAAGNQLEAIQAMTSAYLRTVFPKRGEKLPEGWEWVRLEEAADINPRRPSRLDRDPDAPTTFIPMSAIDGETGRVPAAPERRFEDVRRGYTYFEERDVLFSKITPCMQNGKHFIANGLNGGFGFGTTELHVIRPKSGLFSEWIHCFVRQPSLLKSATYHFRGAVGQQRLPAEFITELLIPLPPLSEQERLIRQVVERLAIIDQAKQSARLQLDRLAYISGSYLRSAFGGKI